MPAPQVVQAGCHVCSSYLSPISIQQKAAKASTSPQRSQGPRAEGLLCNIEQAQLVEHRSQKRQAGTKLLHSED